MVNTDGLRQCAPGPEPHREPRPENCRSFAGYFLDRLRDKGYHKCTFLFDAERDAKYDRNNGLVLRHAFVWSVLRQEFETSAALCMDWLPTKSEAEGAAMG